MFFKAFKLKGVQHVTPAILYFDLILLYLFIYFVNGSYNFHVLQDKTYVSSTQYDNAIKAIRFVFEKV